MTSPRIVFILCPAYHGATLLSLLLNNHGRVFTLADTNPTREYDQGCTCGKMVSTCDFWEGVRASVGWREAQDLPNLMPLYPMFSRNEVLNKSLNTALSVTAAKAGKGIWNIGGKPARSFQIMYRNFLKYCQGIAHHEVFVDGEKSLLKFMTVASMGFPVAGVIHLVRDPRGYAHSCRKYFPDRSMEDIAKDWATHHARIRRFTGLFPDIPVLTVRHEDLASTPQAEMDRVFDFMGLASQEVVCPPVDLRKHHLMGNKMLAAFDGSVQADDAWQKTLSPADCQTVMTAAGPLAGEFGYFL